MVTDDLWQEISGIRDRFCASDQGEFAALPLWFGDLMQSRGIPAHGFHPGFMAHLAYAGWFLFSDRMLLPKFHHWRAVIPVQAWSAEAWVQTLHASSGPPYLKPLRRLARRLMAGEWQVELRLAADFRATLERVNAYQQQQMGISWIAPQMTQALTELAANPIRVGGSSVQALAWDLRSVDRDRLLAADVGYQVGGVYTSLSGCFDRRLPSVGILQLLGQLELMRAQGIQIWDLGMPLPYKLGLGAESWTGRQWVGGIRTAPRSPRLACDLAVQPSRVARHAPSGLGAKSTEPSRFLNSFLPRCVAAPGRAVAPLLVRFRFQVFA